MCGRLNVIDSPDVQLLLQSVGVSSGFDYRDDCPPGGPLSIVVEEEGQRKIVQATWWLLLDSESLKPNYKYPSFNSKSTRLNEKRAIAYKPYRESRCIIPASAFIEGLGDKKTYYKVELENSAIAFGGLYRRWVNKETGEFKYSCSVITLPPLTPEWDHIHPKSFPLMLPYQTDTDIIDKWLDPDFHDVEQFEDLLIPQVTRRQIITKVEKPSTWLAIEDPFFIVPADPVKDL